MMNEEFQGIVIWVIVLRVPSFGLWSSGCNESEVFKSIIPIQTSVQISCYSHCVIVQESKLIHKNLKECKLTG